MGFRVFFGEEKLQNEHEDTLNAKPDAAWERTGPFTHCFMSQKQEARSPLPV